MRDERCHSELVSEALDKREGAEINSARR